MKFKVELFVAKHEFDIPDNKSKSMINALQREEVMKIVFDAIKDKFYYVEMGTVRKVQDNDGRTCS